MWTRIDQKKIGKNNLLKKTTKKKISKIAKKGDCRKESRQTVKRVAKYQMHRKYSAEQLTKADPNLNAS